MNKQVSCKFFQEHLNDYLDSEMDIETRQRMNAHATECPECGERLETMTRLLTMCAELDEGLTIPLDAQAAWRKAVREESTHQQAPKRRGHGFTRALGAVAAAAVLLVGGTFAYRMSGVSPIEQPAGLASYKSAPSAVRSYDSNSNEGAARSRAGAMPIVSEADGEMPKAAQLAPDAPQDAPGAPLVLGDTPDQAEVSTQEATRKPVVLKSAERKMETTGFEQSMVSVQNLV
ncbi:MAG: anti-sigma factor, partial [Clostridia bacterium]